ncbi:unannotated protein [freshwater metagenome]|uniref:Unannotated protein n=1 Tax=freshwater metagenome TaxID=449393 RepID=A0A6J7DG80_9ZZZZ
MTNEHKAALAAGRTEGKAVRDYLEALRTAKPKRGRKRSTDSIVKRLTAIEAEIVDADAVRELKLVQERLDLQAELAHANDTLDLSALEAEFVKVAKGYSTRNGISYAAWRAIGVDAAVLKTAGVTRSEG